MLRCQLRVIISDKRHADQYLQKRWKVIELPNEYTEKTFVYDGNTCININYDVKFLLTSASVTDV